MAQNQDYWIKRFKEKGAFWIHDGDPKKPHVVLTTNEMHSSGYFNSKFIVPDEKMLQTAIFDLLELFSQYNARELLQIQGIVGPQTSGTAIAKMLKQEFTSVTSKHCFWASPEKSNPSETSIKSMIFNEEESKLIKGKIILLCDDVVTSGNSVALTENAVLKNGGIVLPFILVLVNRSGLSEVNGKKIYALINYPMPIWTKEDCPLCKDGSEAIPAAKENWPRLTAD